MMASTGDAAAIIQDLNRFSSQKLENDPKAVKEAIALSKKLTATLEKPVDRATEMVFSPYVATAARIAVDMKLYDHIEEAEGPIATTELARKTGAEELLITRILRLLASIGFVQEADKDLWASTPTTKAMSSSAIASGHRFVWDVLITSAIKSPKYLREIGHKCPSQPTDGFIQYAHQSKHNVFDLLTTMPSLLFDFNNFMGNTMGAREYWVDWFPVEEHLLSGLDTNSALLVDVAGGKGHDVQAFHKKYPGRGRLVLQDLPIALDGITEGELDSKIERQVHDFFTEQPEKGARAYFLHHILHDWSEEYSLKILGHLRDAMKPGYSKLLIHDLILPDQSATTYQCIWDMTMMTFNGGIERSRSQWIDLLDKAGFDLVKFWVNDEEADGIVEALPRT